MELKFAGEREVETSRRFRRPWIVHHDVDTLGPGIDAVDEEASAADADEAEAGEIVHDIGGR